ncbi:hypothetical protein [Psychrobacter sp. JCM 18900]|uniref:hypothetical protein n=1 Tax=Psychrobacter sp. JCM 18900 TaxID=1298608 RepID=UPI000434C4F1|nr:hypothetical protein [Psychrobacter sp. JCM 18900]GAF51894.1 hypothetical protein JCM18900_380 [Psychrobacter sp. JCM 18900]
MPTSEADTTLSAETAAQSTTTDGLTYQSILVRQMRYGLALLSASHILSHQLSLS